MSDMPDNRPRNMCQTLQPPCSNTCFSPTAPCPICDSAHLKLAEIGCYCTCRVVIRPWLTKMWGIVPHLHLVCDHRKRVNIGRELQQLELATCSRERERWALNRRISRPYFRAGSIRSDVNMHERVCIDSFFLPGSASQPFIRAVVRKDGPSYPVNVIPIHWNHLPIQRGGEPDSSSPFNTWISTSGLCQGNNQPIKVFAVAVSFVVRSVVTLLCGLIT
jgi:hypothetical protein